jgi:hypothetical protein
VGNLWMNAEYGLSNGIFLNFIPSCFFANLQVLPAVNRIYILNDFMEIKDINDDKRTEASTKASLILAIPNYTYGGK